MAKPTTYIGLDKEMNGGMTNIGKIIRDAKVFSIIDDEETCEGWNIGRIDALLQQVNDEWDKYSCMVSHLPEDLFKRHQEIHNAGLKNARASGWRGEDETDDEK